MLLCITVVHNLFPFLLCADLVEEVLNQDGDPPVEEVAMYKKRPLKERKPSECVVAVANSLSSLLSNDP